MSRRCVIITKTGDGTGYPDNLKGDNIPLGSPHHHVCRHARRDHHGSSVPETVECRGGACRVPQISRKAV
ncbi:MAG: hypothetical protein IPF98_14865 [Gemmatimonadetes bacterium]|nr:hypothetical protein [Gemmatimonadota bacterium]